jgi:predicted SAM-dependent methyltransferase
MLHRMFVQRRRLARNSARADRCLEIGPGDERIPGFETVNVFWTPVTDYIGDARRLPFPDGTFSIVYASHVLEHTPWYSAAVTLREWFRVLAPGGRVEIWVPDALKIARAFVAAEESGDTSFQQDGWYRFNPDRDPALWFAGRTFSYGDGLGTLGHPNWHVASYSYRLLTRLLAGCGFDDIRRLDKPRGYDHGWINLGVTGRRPG